MTPFDAEPDDRWLDSDAPRPGEPACDACRQPYRLCRCSRVCAECGGLTNHTTAQHRAAQEERDE
jgi:hypothetical protein